MTLAQLWGKYSRLELELLDVTRRPPLSYERLVRLEQDLRSTRQQIMDSREPDEHCDDLGAIGGNILWDGFS